MELVWTELVARVEIRQLEEPEVLLVAICY